MPGEAAEVEPEGEGGDVAPPGDLSPSPFSQGWMSAHALIPEHWPEFEDVSGETYQAVRRAPLSFISRRRAEPEDPELLARRPMPQPTVPQRKAPCPRYTAVPWPQGCPVRPIHISQLYLPGVYNAIMRDVDRVRCACQMGERGQRAPRFEPTVYGPEMQPPWARQCAWDAADPTDVVPLQPSVTPPLQGASPAFFQRWGRLLRWENQDMIRMIGTGIEDGSDCTRATTISGHHSGLRENFEPAAASIEADTEAGFMSEGRQDLWIVPSIMVPKNCVKQRKWKLRDGRLTRVVRWRVTTDDSMSIQGEVSRNMGMDPEDWASPGLPSPRSLAEMVAIVRSSAKAMAIDAGDFELERIALWAFDLSHAYRELGIQRAEQGRQCFIWSDGVRKDMRCVFGAAHMVDLFENVSSFVMAVGRHRIREYERQHPFGAAREAWRRWRADVCDIDEGVGQSTIYLDDGQGLSVLAPGEPLQGSAGFAEQPLTCSVGVEPGGRVKLRTYVNMSRVQIDLAIMVAPIPGHKRRHDIT